MLYSAGIHKGLLPALEGLSSQDKEVALEAAQYAKLDALIRRVDLQEGDHVLEIGCGWGTFAIRMAQQAKVRVTGITVSQEQLVEAQARVAAAGLSDQIEIRFCDYRHVVGTFDKIVSCEMLEAVGHEHLATYFDVLARHLKPGGLAAVQVITLPDERYEAYCNTHSDFIRRYIFPGGHLPSLGVMVALSSRAGLELLGCSDIGPDYAVTLRLWRERMLQRTEDALALGYSHRFLRMYEFYFAYCEAGFANGLIHDYQITWRKSPLAQAASARGAHPSGLLIAGMDPLTAALCCIWGGLSIALVVQRNHMALFNAILAALMLLRTGLTASSLGNCAPDRASTYTALVGSILLTAGSVTVLGGAALTAPPGVGVWHGLFRAIISPEVPAALLSMARFVVGLAAAFAALRAWECVHGRRRLLEAAGYTVTLICTSTALYHGMWLVAIAAAMLCEAHSLLLRVRALQLLSGAPPSRSLWTTLWAAFFLLRLTPHCALLALFLCNPGRGAASHIATLGLLATNLNNLGIWWGMFRAQLADERTAALEATQHRSEYPTSSASASTPVLVPVAAATSPPSDVRCIVATLGVACILAWMTGQQAPSCALLIARTTAAYTLLYTAMRETGLFQPKPGRISATDMAGWRGRVGSMINACILTVGACLCFLEWPYQGGEGFVSNGTGWSHPNTFAALFVGYLQFDLCWCIWHQRAAPDWGSIVHHTLFIAITHYVLWGWYAYARVRCGRFTLERQL